MNLDSNRKYVSAHQPDMFPYELYWRKMSLADEFLLCLDYETTNAPNRFQCDQKFLNWDGVRTLKIPAKMGTTTFETAEINEKAIQHKGLVWRDYHLVQIRAAYGYGMEYDDNHAFANPQYAYKLEKKMETALKKQANGRGAAPFFERFYPAVESIYANHELDTLGSFNSEFIRIFKEIAGINVPMRYTTELDMDVSLADSVEERIHEFGAANCHPEISKLVDWIRSFQDKHYSLSSSKAVDGIVSELQQREQGKDYTSWEEQKEIRIPGTVKLIRMLQQTDGDIYISGRGSEIYLLDSIFQAVDLENIYFPDDEYKSSTEFAGLHPYPQITGNGKFIPNMCALDFLFNVGGLPAEV